jgi:hypothetical protein
VIDRFFLVPKDYSGREVRVRVRLEGEAFPASKPLCTAFNLEFGNTVGRLVSIKAPDGPRRTGLEELYVQSKNVEVVLGNRNSELEVYARLQFAPSSLDRVEAQYIGHTYIDDEPYYGGPREIYERADAKLILLFTKMANPCELGNSLGRAGLRIPQGP